MSSNKPLEARVFEITYDEPTILPSNRWAVYVNFQIIGNGENKMHSERVYTLVCSPAFAKDPGDEMIDDKTITMEHLEKDKLEARIHASVERINSLRLHSWGEYYDQLEKEFYVDD